MKSVCVVALFYLVAVLLAFLDIQHLAPHATDRIAELIDITIAL